jgi:hypothetical protein
MAFPTAEMREVSQVEASKEADGYQVVEVDLSRRPAGPSESSNEGIP